MMQHSELKWAHEKVVQSRRHVEEAFDELEHKLRAGRQTLDRVVFQAQAPMRYAKRYPWVNFAVFAIVGIVLGSRFGKRRDLGYGVTYDVPDLAEEWGVDSRPMRSECL